MPHTFFTPNDFGTKAEAGATTAMKPNARRKPRATMVINVLDQLREFCAIKFL
jgi:hypothetical protein